MLLLAEGWLCQAYQVSKGAAQAGPPPSAWPGLWSQVPRASGFPSSAPMTTCHVQHAQLMASVPSPDSLHGHLYTPAMGQGLMVSHPWPMSHITHTRLCNYHVCVPQRGLCVPFHCSWKTSSRISLAPGPRENHVYPILNRTPRSSHQGPETHAASPRITSSLALVWNDITSFIISVSLCSHDGITQQCVSCHLLTWPTSLLNM